MKEQAPLPAPIIKESVPPQGHLEPFSVVFEERILEADYENPMMGHEGRGKASSPYDRAERE